MLVLKIALALIGLGIGFYAFFGTLFAARNSIPLSDPIIKIYKWAFRVSLMLLLIDLLIIIFC